MYNMIAPPVHDFEITFLVPIKVRVRSLHAGDPVALMNPVARVDICAAAEVVLKRDYAAARGKPFTLTQIESLT